MSTPPGPSSESKENEDPVISDNGSSSPAPEEIAPAAENSGANPNPPPSASTSPVNATTATPTNSDPNSTNTDVQESQKVEGSGNENPDEDDEDRQAEKKLEVMWPFDKNTPLLWACYNGHMEVVWVLLLKGYSPNDLDTIGNNALHLAAAVDNFRIVKVLIDCGCNANKVNMYKNAPVHMASVKEVKSMISVAMEKYASLTNEERENMQLQLTNQVLYYILICSDMINSPLFY